MEGDLAVGSYCQVIPTGWEILTRRYLILFTIDLATSIDLHPE